MRYWLLISLLFLCDARADIQNPPAVLQQGAVIAGDCAQWVGPLTIKDAGTVCGGTGSGVPGGPSGSIQYNNGGNFGGFFVGGDGTLNSATGNLVVTQTIGVPFAPSATTDTTNAANITSGTLAAGRLPNPTATTLGGVESFALQAHKFLTSISTSGVPANAQPSCNDLSNGAASCSTDTTNADNITSGTLSAGLLPSPFTNGTISGNTSEFATATGALTNGDCAQFDANGNIIDAGGACNINGGTVNSGTSGQLGYYASSTNAISGNASATVAGGALTLGQTGSAQGSIVLSGSASGATTLSAPTSGGGILTLPAGSDTLVTLSASQTLANKTLTTPVIASISNTGTLTLPMSNDTLVGRATTDTLTNKSISGASNTLSNIPTGALATAQGNGTKVQLSTGIPGSGDCAKFDANGNVVDQGAPCASPLAIGNAISGGAASRVLYQDASTGNLQSSSNLTFSGSTFAIAGVQTIAPSSGVGLTITPASGTNALNVASGGNVFSVDGYGHIVTTTQTANTPTAVVNSGCNMNGGATVSVTGNDVTGLIALSINSITSNAACVTVTFGHAYPAAPKTILFFPADTSTIGFWAGGAILYQLSTATGNWVGALTAGAITGNVTLQYRYLVIG